MIRQRRRRLGAGLLTSFVALSLLAGCQGSSKANSVNDVKVVGKLGAIPAVSFPTPLSVSATQTRILIEGEGRERKAGEPLLVTVTGFDGANGHVTKEKEAGRPQVVFLTEENFGKEMAERLATVKEGSRVISLQPLAKDGRQSAALTVIDVLHSRAQGEKLPPRPGAPVVTLDPNGAPSLQYDPANRPTTLQIIPLIRGDGPQVGAGDELVLHYTAWTWSDSVVFDSTWVKKAKKNEGTEYDPASPVDSSAAVPAYVTLAKAFTGLRDGLVDQKVGSQVLLIIPPGESIGTDAIVMVVDILAAREAAKEGN